MHQSIHNTVRTIMLTWALLMSLSLCAQNYKASGTVTDDNNEPLVGATVKVEGAPTGVITDLDGKFSVNCNSNSTLDISYIGFVSQKVKAGQNLKIVLTTDARTIDETIVVGIGYGTMRRSDLTGAITSVQAKDLKQGVITSAEQMLQGKVAGLSVVQSSSLLRMEPACACAEAPRSVPAMDPSSSLTVFRVLTSTPSSLLKLSVSTY